MLFENLQSELRNQRWIGSQRLKNLGSKSASDLVFEQFGFLDVRIGRSRFQLGRILQLPNAIVGESLKRVLGVTRISFGTKLHQRREPVVSCFEVIFSPKSTT